jgi:ATP-dependent protease ClpP protease subunit
MYAKIVKDPALCKLDAYTLEEPYVLINDFTKESYKAMMKDCYKLMNAGFDFLPVVIDSYGGQVYSLLAMWDFLVGTNKKIVTIAHGKAMSCGSILFSLGEERYIGEHATVMVHTASNMAWGKESEVKTAAAETTRINNQIFKLLDKNSGQKTGYWKSLIKDIDNGELYLNSKQAMDHGLATKVGIPYVSTEIKLSHTLREK